MRITNKTLARLRMYKLTTVEADLANNQVGHNITSSISEVRRGDIVYKPNSGNFRPNEEYTAGWTGETDLVEFTSTNGEPTVVFSR